MKTFLVRLLGFVLLIPIAYLFGIFICGTFLPRKLQKNIYYRPASKGFTLTRLNEADTLKNINVLVIGSSHAYRGIDPRIFNNRGIKLFNLGTSAQTPLQTLYLVNKYIDKFKPKIVLYEVYFRTFSVDGVEPALDLYSNVKKLDKDLFNMAIELNDVKAYNTFFYVFFKNLLNSKQINEPTVKGLDSYVKGGYVEQKPNVFKPDEIEGDSNFTFDEHQIKAFKMIMSEMKKRNIKVVLFQAPITKDLYNKVNNKASIDSFFIASQPVKYFNFNNSTNFSDDYFIDSHHLNQKGVNQFDNIFIDSLVIIKPLQSLW